MAVYKSTYCSPLLESVDPRVVAFGTDDKPCIWLKTKINSSNKLITGYSIRLLDTQNNIIFPKNDNVIISPLEELTDLNLGGDINSGLNGTLLHVPFFQAWNDVGSIHSRVSDSYNALYYRPVYKADHVLDNPSGAWSYDSSIPGWKNTMGWNGMLNGEFTIEGEVVFVVNASPHNGLYVIDNEGQLIPYEDVDGLQLVQDVTLGYLRLCGTPSADNPRVVALHGDVHNKVYYWNNGWSIEDGAHKDLWTDIDGHLYNLDLENGSYKWEITLYQGAGQKDTAGNADKYSYSDLAFEWFDMMLTTGTILGSTNKRLQIADAVDNGKIPANFGTDPLVLQGKYVQLLDSNGNQIANRAYVRSYDTSLGHVYPDQDAFQLNWINEAQKVAFFQHANNEEQVLANEQTRLATTENIDIYTTGHDKCSNQTEVNEALQNGTLSYYNTNTSMQQNGDGYYEADADFLNDHPYGNSRSWSFEYSTAIDPKKYWKRQPNSYSYKGSIAVKFYNEEGFPSSLTASDITVVCTNAPSGQVTRDGNIQLSFANNRTEMTVTTTWIEQTNYTTLVFKVSGTFSTTWQYYDAGASVLNDNLGLITIDGYVVKDNDVILVKDQNNAQENGIYLAHAGAGWTRSGSYKNWGSFIGKVFFVREGIKNGGTNWESLAGAGGNLYNPESATSGDSPLYFKQEAPILLFGDKIKYGVELIGDFTVLTQGSTKYTTNTVIDGIALVPGQHVYNQNDNKIYIIDVVTAGQSAVLSDYSGIVNIGDYLTVTLGKEYGKSVVKIIQTGTSPDIIYSALITTELSNAYLLKNTTTKTYISPFVGAKAGMAIKLLNNKYVTLASDSSEVRWLKINNLDDTVWCIQHDALVTPLLSASELDDSIPYKYELRSYFKASDENPFNCYEAPYLKLKINDCDYIGFINTEPYDVIDLAQEVEYLVSEGTYNVVIPGLTTIDYRQVKFTGLYYQHQQMSWESYQWILIDKNGNIAQDTGKRYDKEMSVTFYGLENGSNYAAILYVTDDVNNILTLTIYFKVDFEPTTNLDGMDFTAEFDCSTHSVVLNFGSFGLTAPSVETAAGSFKYVADNYRVSAFEWDSSYTTIAGILDVFDTINRDSLNNPYPLPLFDIYENAGSIPYTGLSASVRNGINYSHLFANDVLEVPVESNLIETELELPDGNNKFYIETKIQLTENYCGKFFSFEVENNAGVSASIEFGVGDNFTQHTPTLSNLLFTRNRVYVHIRSNGNTSTDWLYNGNNYFENFSLNNINKKFILQNPYGLGDPDPEIEYHALEYAVEGLPPSEKYAYMWYKRQKADDKVYYENSPFDLGNLCLVKSSHTPGPIYWSENRGEIYYLTSDTAPTGTFSNYCREQNSESIPGINLTVNKPEAGKNITDEAYMPIWPSDADAQSKNLYWMENTEDSQYQPVFWDDVVADPNNNGIDSKRLTRYVVRPRHPETQLSQKPWVIILKCFDLTTFINSVGSLTFTGDTDNDYTTHVSANGNVVLDIIFIPIQSTEGGN